MDETFPRTVEDVEATLKATALGRYDVGTPEALRAYVVQYGTKLIKARAAAAATGMAGLELKCVDDAINLCEVGRVKRDVLYCIVLHCIVCSPPPAAQQVYLAFVWNVKLRDVEDAAPVRGHNMSSGIYEGFPPGAYDSYARSTRYSGASRYPGEADIAYSTSKDNGH